MTQSDRIDAAEPLSSGISFNRFNFDPDGSCQWIFILEGGLEIYGLDGSYIAAPKPDQDRALWLKALRQYREDVRAGQINPQSLDLNFNSERAWIRLANPLSKALALTPGDRLDITIEARWLEGNNELCVALDRNSIDNDTHSGWSDVLGTGTIERDGQWHIIDLIIDVPETIDMNGVYLRPIVGMDATHDPAPGHVQVRRIDLSLPGDAERTHALHETAGANPHRSIDRSLYDEASQTWMQGAFTCHFTFMYDRTFYNPDTGEYQLARFLDEGEREFGGYDILLLWHAYPRIGLDGRNQLDFYRDMPGGLEGIRSLVDQAHARGVKVFINYNPWDRATSREGRSDEDFLVELVAETDMDGIFLDTMVGDSPQLREKLEAVRPGVSLTPELNPPIQSLAICNGSWAQGLYDENDPGLNHLKWIEPRHMRWRIWRWNTNHRDEIRHAFFNGSGMLVWENVFGSHVRWTLEDRRMWRRAVAILRQFQDNFNSDAWEPFIEPASSGEGLMNNDGLFIHRWPGDKSTVYTIYMKEKKPAGAFLLYDLLEVPLIRVPANPEIDYYDAWNGKPAHVETSDGMTTVYGFIDRISGLACIVAVPKSRLDGEFIRFMTNQRSEAMRAYPPDDERGLVKSMIESQPVALSEPASHREIPEGMVFVPGGPARMKLEHVRRECGCYPDPGTPFDQWEKYFAGHNHMKNIMHDYTVDVNAYFIDEAAVTNAEFKRFLDESAYQPAYPENFLKHWPGGVMPDQLADHPVVYVDLKDARAYAKWAGKRLPTEPEWQRAAQGTDGRKWPWGNDFDPEHPDPALVNTTGATLPVRALPASRSPYGCYQMSGNVYEWTESERDDGFTRFCIIRGGSYMKVEGSVWYMDGGPRPCDHHAKFIMMWPGLDRCSTVGFRCVKDVEK